ncbi:hypothetical protein [Petrachloros mirabilis]
MKRCPLSPAGKVWISYFLILIFCIGFAVHAWAGPISLHLVVRLP